MENKINLQISDHDRKLLYLMKEKILAFKSESLTIGELIPELEALYRELDLKNEKWKESFFNGWAQLEIAYASALAKKLKAIPLEEQKRLSEILIEMSSLIESTLQNYNRQKDTSVLKRAIILNEKWLMCPDCTDAWEISSSEAMVICPKCDSALHNPRYREVGK